MVDVTVSEATAADRARVLRGFISRDRLFFNLTRSSALLVLIILFGVMVSLIIGATPAFRAFGFSFFTTQSWNPVTEKFGALAPIYGTLVTSVIAMAIAVPVGIGVAIFLTELCPRVLSRPIGIAIELLAGIPSIIYGIWGLFVFAPFLQQTLQPALIELFGPIPVLSTLFAGPPYGIGMLTAGLILAIMVLPFITSITRDVFETTPAVLKESAYALGATTWEVVWKVVLPYTRAGVLGGVMLGTRARARRNHGGHLRDRQRPQDQSVAAGARYHDLRHHRQRVHRGRRRPLYLVADRARSHPVPDHLHRAGDRALPIEPHPAASGDVMSHYSKRLLKNRIWLSLSAAAALFGLAWLVLILAVLVAKGLAGLSLNVFTEMTPPPGSDGGLLNAIVGSLIMTGLAVVIGTPVGVLAGTYMAEYGRHDRLTAYVRFINDILLSAPSIVIGLFVYEIMVVPMGHFSGLAGAVALADHRGAGGGAHHRGHAAARAEASCARRRARLARRAGS